MKDQFLRGLFPNGLAVKKKKKKKLVQSLYGLLWIYLSVTKTGVGKNY